VLVVCRAEPLARHGVPARVTGAHQPAWGETAPVTPGEPIRDRRWRDADAGAAAGAVGWRIRAAQL